MILRISVATLMLIAAVLLIPMFLYDYVKPKKMNKIYKNWWVHNLLAHPLMQIISLFDDKLAKFIHNKTLPNVN